MTSQEIRASFLDFFSEKKSLWHCIVCEQPRMSKSAASRCLERHIKKHTLHDQQKNDDMMVCNPCKLKFGFYTKSYRNYELKLAHQLAFHPENVGKVTYIWSNFQTMAYDAPTMSFYCKYCGLEKNPDKKKEKRPVYSFMPPEYKKPNNKPKVTKGLLLYGFTHLQDKHPESVETFREVWIDTHLSLFKGKMPSPSEIKKILTKYKKKGKDFPSEDEEEAEAEAEEEEEDEDEDNNEDED
jgi:hypothetical protein